MKYYINISCINFQLVALIIHQPFYDCSFLVLTYTLEIMTNFYFKTNQVRVNTVLGSAAPPLKVRLVRAFRTDAKDTAIIESEVSDDSQ